MTIKAYKPEINMWKASDVAAIYKAIPGSKDASSTVGPGYYTGENPIWHALTAQLMQNQSLATLSQPLVSHLAGKPSPSLPTRSTSDRSLPDLPTVSVALPVTIPSVCHLLRLVSIC